MLTDYFFKAYAETAPRPAEGPAPDIPVKESYTRAEVDDIISRKLEEAVKQMSGKDVIVSPVEPEDTPEVSEETE
jgi:hypothetical protein